MALSFVTDDLFSNRTKQFIKNSQPAIKTLFDILMAYFDGTGLVYAEMRPKVSFTTQEKRVMRTTEY